MQSEQGEETNKAGINQAQQVKDDPAHPSSFLYVGHGPFTRKPTG